MFPDQLDVSRSFPCGPKTETGLQGGQIPTLITSMAVVLGSHYVSCLFPCIYNIIQSMNEPHWSEEECELAQNVWEQRVYPWVHKKVKKEGMLWFREISSSHRSGTGYVHRCNSLYLL